MSNNSKQLFVSGRASVALYDVIAGSTEPLRWRDIKVAAQGISENSLSSATDRLLKMGAIGRIQVDRVNGRPAYAYFVTEAGKAALVNRTDQRIRRGIRSPLAPAAPLPPPVNAPAIELRSAPAQTLIKVGSYRFGSQHIIFTDETSRGEIQVTLDLTEFDVRTNKRHHKVLRFEGDEARQMRVILDQITIGVGDASEELERLRVDLTAAEQLAQETEARALRAEAELKTLRERLRGIMGQ